VAAGGERRSTPRPAGRLSWIEVTARFGAAARRRRRPWGPTRATAIIPRLGLHSKPRRRAGRGEKPIYPAAGGPFGIGRCAADPDNHAGRPTPGGRICCKWFRLCALIVNSRRVLHPYDRGFFLAATIGWRCWPGVGAFWTSSAGASCHRAWLIARPEGRAFEQNRGQKRNPVRRFGARAGVVDPFVNLHGPRCSSSNGALQEERLCRGVCAVRFVGVVGALGVGSNGSRVFSPTAGTMLSIQGDAPGANRRQHGLSLMPAVFFAAAEGCGAGQGCVSHRTASRWRRAGATGGSSCQSSPTRLEMPGSAQETLQTV